jgi:hypothetical protein
VGALLAVVVNHNDKLLGAFVRWETTTEGRAMIEMVRAHGARRTEQGRGEEHTGSSSA